MDQLKEMLEATGFFEAAKAGEPAAVGEPEPPRRVGNLIELNFAERTDRGDPFTRAERVRLRAMLEVFEALVADKGGCPMATGIAKRVKGA